MDFALKRPSKSHGSYKQTKRLSVGGAGGGSGEDAGSHEELPILARHITEDPAELQKRSTEANIPLSDRPEVIVKVDGSHSDSSSSSGSIKGRNSNSNTNTQHGNQDTEDPPSRLISQFLNQQKNLGGEISLDMDMEMGEFRNESHERNLPPFPESPMTRGFSKEMRVSFEPTVSSGIDPTAESVRRRYKDESQQQKQEEILRCTSNSSFKRQTNTLTTLKTKSRLLDPEPAGLERMSGKVPKSEALKSGVMPRAADEEEEDDPLADEDLPEEFTNSKLSAATLLQWLSLIAIVGALMCTLAFESFMEKKIMHLRLWKWEVLLLVLICGRLFSGWVIRVIVFLIERNFLLRKRVLYFVYGLRKGVQNCCWLGLVLLAWHFLFDARVEEETGHEALKYVTKLLVCLLAASVIWLIKTLMVKVLASSFHVSTYFDRIQESVFNQFIIETLSGPPVIEVQRAEEEMERTIAEIRRLQNAGATIPPDLRATVFPYARSGKFVGNVGPQKSFAAKSFKISGQLSKKGSKKGDDGIKIERLHKLNNKNVSAWNMKRLMKIVRNGSLSTLDEQILGSSGYDESTREIRSEYEAKAAARKIFFNVARNRSKYIYLEDLMRFMEVEQAIKTMELIEGSSSENSRISKSSLKIWVVNAFRERKALALTLNDTKTAVNKLHSIIDVIVGILTIVICLVILGVATSKFFVVLGSQIVVVSFIFGNTAKILFESVIFLFVIHPFDVGDRCEVDGVQLIVEEMNILTTLFLRYDNQKVIFPNAVLATKPIGNYYRSPDMCDVVEFFIHIATPMEKIATMKQRIISYIDGKKEYWYPNTQLVFKEIHSLNSVKMALWPRHRINHQDIGARFDRRSFLLEEMVKIFQELDIQYRLYPRDINILAKPPSKPYYPA